MLLTSAAVWSTDLLGDPSRMQTDFGGRVGIWAQSNPWVSCFLEVVNQRIRSCDAKRGVWWKADAAFTFAGVLHADTADWPGGKVRSGEGWHGSSLSSLCPSDKNEEMGDFISDFSSSLSISRATKLGLENKKTQFTTEAYCCLLIKNTEISSYLRSQPSTPGLSLSLLGSEEAEPFSLARARSPSESRGVHGAEGEWKPSKCSGRVSVSSRRSSESTVSVITPSVSVLSTVTPLMLHWLPALSTWGRKPRNIFENEKTPHTELIKFLPFDLVLLRVGLLLAGDHAEVRICSRLEELL